MREIESLIQVAVVQHLAWRGIPGLFWTHFPAGGLRNPIVAAQLKAAGTKAGVPDILLLANGRLYGLELKSLTGRLSANQVATHAAMREAGAIIGVAAGVDEALELLDAWGLLRS
jgi:hypothetical protein